MTNAGLFIYLICLLLNYKKDVYCTRDVSIRNDVLQPKVICQFKTKKKASLFLFYLSAQGQVGLFLLNWLASLIFYGSSIHGWHKEELVGRIVQIFDFSTCNQSKVVREFFD